MTAFSCVLIAGVWFFARRNVFRIEQSMDGSNVTFWFGSMFGRPMRAKPLSSELMSLNRTRITAKQEADAKADTWLIHITPMRGFVMINRAGLIYDTQAMRLILGPRAII